MVYLENVGKYTVHSSQLEILHIEFSRRFNNFLLLDGDFRLLADLFNFYLNESSPDLQLELLEFTSDSYHSNDFKNSHIIKFYASLNDQAFFNLKTFAKNYSFILGRRTFASNFFSL